MADSRSRRRKPRQKRQRGNTVRFPAGTKLIYPGHPSSRIYVLNSGQVRLLSSPKAIVELLTPGYFFGEKCFLAPRRRDQIAVTLSAGTATTYRRSELLSCLQRDRRFAGRLLKNLALRMDRYEQTIRDFVTERGERRLALLLSRFAPARPPSGWVRLPLRATNVELAAMVGMTKWRVSHFLNQFQRMGWLNRRRQELRIDREGLERFLAAGAGPA